MKFQLFVKFWTKILFLPKSFDICEGIEDESLINFKNKKVNITF